MKIRVNDPCPCGSKIKYKLCCQKYHKGAHPKDALSLMKSRYSAYAVGDIKYIIKTTHPENPEYQEPLERWQKSIENFCKENSFLALEIESFLEDKEYAFVTFKAYLSEGVLYEKSRFIQNRGLWFYLDGEIK